MVVLANAFLSVIDSTRGVFSVSDMMIRWVSLAVLIVQNAALVLVMRYSRTRPGDMYISTTAVVMAEVMKLTFCLGVTLYEHHGSISGWLHYLNEVNCYVWSDQADHE